MQLRFYYKMPDEGYCGQRPRVCHPNDEDIWIYYDPSLEDNITALIAKVEKECASGYSLVGVGVWITHPCYLDDLLDVFLRMLFDSKTCERYFKRRKITVQIHMNANKVFPDAVPSLFVLNGKHENVFIEMVDNYISLDLWILNRKLAAKNTMIYGRVEEKLEKLFTDD